MYTKYVVAVVYSQMSLSKICNFMEDYLSAKKDDIGVIKIDRYRGTETNRTIILMNRNLYTHAIEQGLNHSQPSLDFKINEYKCKYNDPTDKETYNLYIHIPGHLETEDVQNQLDHKLQILHRFGVLNIRNIQVSIPLKSRETGEHNNAAYLIFPEEYDKYKIKLIRCLIHDTKFITPDNKHYYIGCYWARKKQ